MKYLLPIVLIHFFVSTLYSQPQTNNWFFSGRNGLNFSSGNPVNIPGGQIIVMEGASAVSDKTGQLLFYTDGITVWNKNHGIMSNGQGLSGGYGSSTQSCIIVPKTRDEKQYYIFTTDDEWGPRGLQYSIVDMSLNGGLGAVTIKNSPLVTRCSEKVTAVRHCNKKDYWVITQKGGTNAYYAYLATENGVNPNPVISNTGSFLPIGYYTMAGQLKSSPDGKKIVAINKTIGVELSDFNNQTGVLSNTNELFENNNSGHYGAEFSNDSKMLYTYIHGYWDDVDITRYSGVFQFNISLPSIQQIRSSKFEVFRQQPLNAGSSLQRANNGKIYLNQYEKSYLSAINSPEISGTGCNFIEMAVTLPNIGKASLPNFINDYNTSTDSFRVNNTGTCINLPISFSYTVTGDVTALLWDFGDPLSGSQNSSTIANPSHTFSSANNYTIRLIKYSPCGNDTLTKQIIVGDLQVNLGSDTTICENSSYTLIPQTSGATSYLWQDGSTNSTYSASSSGVYWLQVSNNTNGCIKRDSIILSTKPLPILNLGRDTTLCPGASLQLNASNSGAQYIWQDNSTSQTFLVSNPNTYWVEVNLNGCRKRDTINVTSLTKPQFSLGPDQYLCPGLTLLLSPNLNNVNYTWQDGSSNNTYLINKNGIYYLDISNSCGTFRDSINILPGNCTIYVPSGFTPNNDGLNDKFQALGTGLVSEFELVVFDRSGQLLFRTKDKNGYWDGDFKGNKMPSAIYVYMIMYKELNRTEKKILKGTFLLAR